MKTVRAVCPHDCPDTCAMLVDVDDNGRAVRVTGDPSNPFTHGGLCVKVAHYEKRTYHSDRVLYPLKRAGRKGEGKFERISWDEALDIISERLRTIAAENPESILPYSYAGTMGLLQGGSMDRRFFHRLGASLLDRTICSTAGMYGMRYTVGASVGNESRNRGSGEIHPDLGLERHHVQHPSVAIHPEGTLTGREDRDDRSAPDTNRRAIRRAHPDHARHGRRAGARNDAHHSP